MTDEQYDTTEPAGEPAADEQAAPPPPPGAEGAWNTGSTGAGSDSATGGSQTAQWIAQLERMINGITAAGAPAARQVGAKAAELAAVAAVKAGPAAQRAAELTTDYGQRFAERAVAVANELRAEQAAKAGSESTEDADGASAGPESEAAAEAAPAEADAPAAPVEGDGSGI